MSKKRVRDPTNQGAEHGREEGRKEGRKKEELVGWLVGRFWGLLGCLGVSASLARVASGLSIAGAGSVLVCSLGQCSETSPKPTLNQTLPILITGQNKSPKAKLCTAEAALTLTLTTIRPTPTLSQHQNQAEAKPKPSLNQPKTHATYVQCHQTTSLTLKPPAQAADVERQLDDVQSERTPASLNSGRMLWALSG